jgi:hypothetical protein
VLTDRLRFCLIKNTRSCEKIDCGHSKKAELHD